jgi:hypothetical protein
MKSEIGNLILLWSLTFIALYIPLLTGNAKPETRKWVNSILLTVVTPLFINMVARGTGMFKKFGVDYRYIITASVVTFLLFIAYLQNEKLKTSITEFGESIESTGTTLGLLIPTFIVGLFIANIQFGGAMYTHYY